MYQLYFKCADGKYHYGQFFEDVGEAAKFALEFRDAAPSIMITHQDCSVFEVENGVVIYPDDEDYSEVPRLGLSEKLPSNIEEYEALVSWRNETPQSDDLFSLLEAMLLASAARDGINLHKLGWSLPA